MKNKTKQVNIRFLKQGLIPLDVPLNASIEEIQKLGKQYINTMSDRDLLYSMSDCIPSGMNPSRFDDASFNVDAIEDAETYELLYSNDLWNAYLKE